MTSAPEASNELGCPMSLALGDMGDQSPPPSNPSVASYSSAASYGGSRNTTSWVLSLLTEASKESRHTPRMNLKPFRNPQTIEVLAKGLQRRRRPLHKRHLRRSAAQRLNAHRPRSRIEIEKRRPLNPRRQHVKQRLAQPVAGGPRRQPRRRSQHSRSITFPQ